MPDRLFHNTVFWTVMATGAVFFVCFVSFAGLLLYEAFASPALPSDSCTTLVLEDVGR